MASVKESIEAAVAYLTENPEEARYTDSVAVAKLEDSLRVVVTGPTGEKVTTDMPTAIGGHGEKASPGWLYRASVASCVAATVAMEAASSGVTLSSLTVEVDSQSDDRGILGIDAGVSPGPMSASVRILLEADGVGDADLKGIAERGAWRCPVLDLTRRETAISVDIQSG